MSIRVFIVEGEVHGGFWPPGDGGPGRGSEFGDDPQEGAGGQGEGAVHCSHHRKREEVHLRNKRNDAV